MRIALETLSQSPLILYLGRNLRAARCTAASLTLPVSFRIFPKVASDLNSGIGGCKFRLSASLLLDFASLGWSPVAVPPIVSKSAWLTLH
jgi:hypothetical protein